MHRGPSLVPPVDTLRRRCACSLSANQEVAVLAIDGTEIAAEAQRRHGLAPTASDALGRALLGSLLLGTFRKADDSLQVRASAASCWKACTVTTCGRLTSC